jgi:hypothetical protein
MIGLELHDVAVDACITKAPCGGDCAGPSPVDRRRGGLKRSVAVTGSAGAAVKSSGLCQVAVPVAEGAGREP